MNSLPFKTDLECKLIEWACDNFPTAVDAIEQRLDDAVYVSTACGRIFRRVIEGQPEYLYAIVSSVPDQLLQLSPYIREVQMPWGSMPGPRGWKAWIEHLQRLEEFDPSGELPLMVEQPAEQAKPATPKPKPTRPEPQHFFGKVA